jgi:hypothetical protein
MKNFARVFIHLKLLTMTDKRLLNQGWHCLINRLKILSVVLLSMFSQSVSAQSSNVCRMNWTRLPSADQDLQRRPPVVTNCGHSSEVYNNFFRQKESFLPSNLTTTPATVNKEMKIRFVVINPNPNAPKQLNFTSANMDKLNLLVQELNVRSSFISAPNKSPSTCNPCHLHNQRLSFKLTDVEFVTSTNDYSAEGGFDYSVHNHGKMKDSILNIYLVCGLRQIAEVINGDTVYGTGGWARYLGFLPTNAYYSANNYIVMQNIFLSAQTESLYRQPWHSFDHFIRNESYRLLHEINHAMGLHHLYGDETCDPSAPDYLADIFSGGPISCPTNPDASLEPFDPLVNATNNNMDAKALGYISPMQISRNIRNAFIGDCKSYIYPTEAPNVNPWIVNSDQTWDFAIRMYQDIIVKPGTTLTIKCEVQMPSGSRILVEKGAKLIIDAGRVTSYHQRRRWNGIELVGNRNLTSTPANQGSVELINGGIIENAWNGIRNFTWDNGAQGGGIIKASNAYFYNCWRGVELNDYGNYNYATGNCRFNNVSFLIDDMSAIWNQGSPFAGQFTAWNIKGGVAINNCTFKNEIPYNLLGQHSREEAIVSCSSGLTISGSTFDGFKKGVCANSVDAAPRPTKIYNNTFENITNSIIVGAEAYSDIRNNSIKKMTSYIVNNGNQALFASGVGIYLDRTIGSYVACENVVDGVPGSGSSNSTSLNPVGLVANHTHAGGATVLENTFSNIKRGTQTQKNNPKLNIVCNTYNNNNVALLVNSGSPNGYVLQNQGTGCSSQEVRAGNKFNNNVRDITSYLQTWWSYYAFTGANNYTVEFPYLSSSNFGLTNCPSTDNYDRQSQCTNYFKCKVVAFPEMAKLKSDFGIIKANGHAFSAEGQLLFGNIVRLYNEADDDAGLISFLVAENDDHARKLLIPLYIRQGNYSSAITAANHLTLAADEKNAYLNYYNIIGTLHYDQRRPDQLTSSELATVQSLAAGELEVSGFAKALLEVGHYEEWIHPVEDEADFMTLKPYNPGNVLPNDGETTGLATGDSRLFVAAPNPAQDYTIIHSFISKADAEKGPALVLHNMTGEAFFKQALQPGDNYIRINTADLPGGIYFYSLNIGKRTIKTEKLSIVK